MRVLRRVAGSWTFIIAMGALFLAGFAGSTFAYFDGEVDQTATYAGGYVAAPTNAAATAFGYDGVVTWTPPAPVTTTVAVPTYVTDATSTTPTTVSSTVTTTPGVQGQRVLMMDNGSTASCSGVTYTTTLVSGLAPTVSTYTDSNRTATTGAAHQFCYQVQSYWTTNSWYQGNAAPVAQLGLVLQSVQIANGGVAGTLDGNDTIQLTFNQKPATPANGTVCTFHTGGIIFLGDSACSVSTDTFVVGKLAGFTVGGVGHQKRSGTVSVSNTAPWVMTVTVGQTGQKVSGSGTFTPAPTIVSAATPDTATICNSGSACLPTPTGSF